MSDKTSNGNSNWENLPAEAPSSDAISQYRDGDDLMFNPEAFDQAQRVARMLAKSDLVPQAYRSRGDHDEKRAIANCFIALQMAKRMQIDPFMFMQNSYVVHGRPGIEAKLAIALANRHGPFTGPIQWAVDRDENGQIVSCTAFATHKVTGETCEATITREMVEAEGWHLPKGQTQQTSKWVTMPEQMYRYRSAMFLIRLYAPEVLLGMRTVDELEDMGEEIEATVEDPPVGRHSFVKRPEPEKQIPETTTAPVATESPEASEPESTEPAPAAKKRMTLNRVLEILRMYEGSGASLDDLRSNLDDDGINVDRIEENLEKWIEEGKIVFAVSNGDSRYIHPDFDEKPPANPTHQPEQPEPERPDAPPLEMKAPEPKRNINPPF